MLASSLLLIAAGEPIVEMLFEGGEFGSDDTSLVWLILVFYAFGLPAIGLSRMLQNASFAMGDTSGPARLAALRVTIAAVVGVLVMFPLDRAFIGADGIEALGDAIGLAGPSTPTSAPTSRLSAWGGRFGDRFRHRRVGRTGAAGQAPRSSSASAATALLGALATDDCRIHRLRRHGGDEPADRITSVPGRRRPDGRRWGVRLCRRLLPHRCPRGGHGAAPRTTGDLALSRRPNEAFLIYDHCHAQLPP